ncbi:MAG: nitroreductase family protein [Nanoarchaeota archaeon]
MNLSEALAGRRSIRSFKLEPVPENIIKEVLHAGILAPAPSNRQQWEVVIVQDRSIIERLFKDAGSQEQILHSPCLFVLIVDMEFNKENFSNVQATAAAVQNMQLKAVDIGYGSCCMAGIGDVKKIKNILNIPDPWLPVCFMMLGKPSEAPTAPARKELGEIYHYNKYSSKSERMQSSVFPKDWTLNQLRLHQKFVSRAYKMGIDYEFYDPIEIENIKKVVDENIVGKKKVLTLLGYDGTVIKNLDPMFKDYDVVDCELSQEAVDFVKSKTKNLKFTLFSDKIENIKDSSVDLIIITFALEKLPAIDIILKESKRVLSKKGKILIFFKNRKSFYGLMYKGITGPLGVKHLEGFYIRSGPFSPISSSEISKEIKKLKLHKVSEGGFFLIPAEVKIYNDKFDGYINRHGKKLSIMKYAMKPVLGFSNMMFNITKSYKKPFMAVTKYVIIENSKKEEKV